MNYRNGERTHGKIKILWGLATKPRTSPSTASLADTRRVRERSQRLAYHILLACSSPCCPSRLWHKTFYSQYGKVRPWNLSKHVHLPIRERNRILNVACTTPSPDRWATFANLNVFSAQPRFNHRRMRPTPRMAHNSPTLMPDEIKSLHSVGSRSSLWSKWGMVSCLVPPTPRCKRASRWAWHISRTSKLGRRKIQGRGKSREEEKNRNGALRCLLSLRRIINFNATRPSAKILVRVSACPIPTVDNNSLL